MIDAEDKLEQQVRQSWPPIDAGKAPSFAAAWQAAERRHAMSRRRNRVFAGAAAAAVIAVVVVGMLLQAPPSNGDYIAMDELMSSTSWTAPSDVLLPEHEFDIYQELPSLLESTETGGGSLL